MICAGDKIVVGLSWGKDSTILMHVMHHLQRHSPEKFDLCAVWVDAGFNDDEREAMASYATEQGWTYETVRISMEEIVREKDALDQPCSLCSRLRRGKLHFMMDRLGYRTLALAHHCEDLVVSLLMSMFRGGGMKTMGPNVPADGGTKRLIRPLCKVTKELIAEAAREMQVPVFGKCPYITQINRGGDREFLKNLLRDLNSRFPGIAQAILRSMGDVRIKHLLDTRYLDLPCSSQGQQERRPS